MKKFITTMAIIFAWGLANAQSPKLAVISFDANAAELNAAELIELLRIEITKHKKYQVLDRYEINEVLTAADISPATCVSKSCLLKAGETLKADYVVSGTADKLGEALFIRLRMLDLKQNGLQTEVVKEFLYIPEKIANMVSISANELIGIPNDPVLEKSLSNKDSYESAVNNPYIQTLELNGPRMGYTFFTGETAKSLARSRNDGGYDAYPAFFQIGYQFEKQYLNEGKVQALFEVIPLISGMDQGLFIPSVTLMNGLRNNKNGLEIAVGPSINIVRETIKYELDGEWVRPQDQPNIDNLPEEYKFDSRGLPRIKTYVVLAAGYSFRSGRLNIPVNAFFVPTRQSPRFGFSVGFNARKSKQ